MTNHDSLLIIKVGKQLLFNFNMTDNGDSFKTSQCFCEKTLTDLILVLSHCFQYIGRIESNMLFFHLCHIFMRFTSITFNSFSSLYFFFIKTLARFPSYTLREPKFENFSTLFHDDRILTMRCVRLV